MDPSACSDVPEQETYSHHGLQDTPLCIPCVVHQHIDRAVLLHDLLHSILEGGAGASNLDRSPSRLVYQLGRNVDSTWLRTTTSREAH